MPAGVSGEGRKKRTRNELQAGESHGPQHRVSRQREGGHRRGGLLLRREERELLSGGRRLELDWHFHPGLPGAGVGRVDEAGAGLDVDGQVLAYGVRAVVPVRRQPACQRGSDSRRHYRRRVPQPPGQADRLAASHLASSKSKPCTAAPLGSDLPASSTTLRTL